MALTHKKFRVIQYNFVQTGGNNISCLFMGGARFEGAYE